MEKKTISFPYIIDLLPIMMDNKEEESILLESADIATKLGEQSLYYFDFSLKIIGKNNEVTIKALNSDFLYLIKEISVDLKKYIKIKEEDQITFSFSSLKSETNLENKLSLPSMLSPLRCLLNKIKEPLVGFFAYDFLDHFEDLPKAKFDPFNIPDFLFYLPKSQIKVDHKNNKTICISDRKEIFDQLNYHASTASAGITNQIDIKYNTDITDEDFIQLVKLCQEHIKAGDVYQIVPSRTFSLPIKDEFLSYNILRRENPSPYMFFLNTKEIKLLGSSPETFIKVDGEKRIVTIKPIAGTRIRGFDKMGKIDDEQDSRNEASLCLDEKELAEHMMLVDLARNDIASIAKPKSRKVEELLTVDKLGHVMHLVSKVVGTLRDETDSLSAYQSAMNMGTLMGAPKIMAATLLRKYEKTKRGVYGGAIGYLCPNGDMDLSIIIRSALIKDHTAYIRTGCGVVLDSVPTYEKDETINKAMSVLKAISIANGMI